VGIDMTIYKPEELYFAIYLGEYTEVHVIHKSWLEMVNQIPDGDNLGKHNVDNDALRAAGLNTNELMECVFTPIDEAATFEEIKAQAIAAALYSIRNFKTR
jgi:hypothetical protein